jgi:isopentenyl diphosphate isomerase/L-lactate dehydrogenase-like FMN-dependent dehydrogenase
MIATSPALAYLTLSPAILSAFGQEQFREGPATTDLITSPSEALTVFDFEAVAKKKLHYGHVAFLAGTEDEGTYRANREGFEQYQLRVRRLVDFSKTDMSVSLFGTAMARPILLCPCGGLGSLHPDGEAAVARAAKTRNYLQVLSNAASKSIEDCTAARGGPVWFQLYRVPDWNKTLAMIKRAEAAGSTVMAFTVDGLAGDKREFLARARRKDRQFCGGCHKLNPADQGLTLPAFLGSKPMDATKPLGPPMIDGDADWDYLKRIKDSTKMKVLVKGIVTREDAELAIQYGADGVWISNHGGRKENSLRSTIECIPEVAAAVGGRVPIVVDGGFRRGTDIFKALALGATTVGVGRPYLYGLASFGQEGVETVLDILDNELKMVMRQAGTTSVAKITKDYVADRYRRR